MATQTVIVTCAPDPESIAEFKVDQVDPHTVDLFIGDSVIWQVSGIPEGHFLAFDLGGLFENPPDPAEGNGSTVTAEAGSFEPSVQTSGTFFSYFLTPQDSSRRPGNKFDPMIDSLGPPGPVDDGGGS